MERFQVALDNVPRVPVSCLQVIMTPLIGQDLSLYIVCRVGFTPMDRYKRHLNSLFHMRKSAGESIEWIEGGSRNDL